MTNDIAIAMGLFLAVLGFRSLRSWWRLRKVRYTFLHDALTLIKLRLLHEVVYSVCFIGILALIAVTGVLQ